MVTKAKVLVQVNLDRCKGCGICVELCPRAVFSRNPDDTARVANLDNCTACRLCELWCPDFAIALLPIGGAE